MLNRFRKSMADKDQGFTLIELLVVIIIIGILAAVAVPVFLNQRKKGVDATMKSDLKNFATVFETYATNGGPALDTAGPIVGPWTVNPDGTVGIGWTQNWAANTPLVVRLSPGNAMTVTKARVGAYCLHVTNAGGTDPTNGYWYDSAAGGMQPGGTTACPTTV